MKHMLSHTSSKNTYFSPFFLSYYVGVVWPRSMEHATRIFVEYAHDEICEEIICGSMSERVREANDGSSRACLEGPFLLFQFLECQTRRPAFSSTASESRLRDDAYLDWFYQTWKPRNRKTEENEEKSR